MNTELGWLVDIPVIDSREPASNGLTFLMEETCQPACDGND